MRRGRFLVAVALIAAGCGGGDGKDEPAADRGKVVSGVTETGMKLKVETFLAPAADRGLAKLDAYRSSTGYEAVDYHRITADNSKGSVPDRGRPVEFSRTPEGIATGQAVETRFICDVLEFEWLPPEGSAEKLKAWRSLRSELCANGPPKPDGIAPGRRQAYFVITDRGFASRGIEQMRVFGPLSAELR